MALSLDNIVDMTITAETTSVAQTGFGVPLLLTYHDEFESYAETFGPDLAELVEAGFATTSPTYAMFQAVIQQDPSVDSIVVGRRATAFTQKYKITPTVANSTDYSLKVGTEEFLITSGGSATAEDIVEALVTEMNASAQAFTTSGKPSGGSSTYVEFVADVAGAMFHISSLSSNLTIENITADPGLAADLARVREDDDSWYTLLLDSQGAAEISAAAAPIETLNRLFIASTSDSGVANGDVDTDIASTLQAAAYDRTAVLFSKTTSQFGAAGWAGKMLPYDPGSAQWSYKTIAGLTYDALTTAQVTALESKNANYYARVAGNNITRLGKVASGEWIDTMQTIDWLKARIQEAVFAVLLGNPKLAFTDESVELIKGTILNVLRLGQQMGMLDRSVEPTVTAPKVSAVSTADRINRVLPDVKFSARLSGGIVKFIIDGTLTV